MVNTQKPPTQEAFDSSSDADGWKQNLIALCCVSFLIVMALITIIVIINRRKEVQPLKIKSPKLLMWSVFANLLMVVALTIM